MVTFLITVKSKNHVQTVVELIKKFFKKDYKSIDPTLEDEFAKVITLVLKKSTSGEKALKIKNEIRNWQLINGIFDDYDDKTLFKLTKKFCAIFTIQKISREKERNAQLQLFSYLEAQFGDHEVKWEKVHPTGKRPDIVVRKNICVEVKVPKTTGEIQRIFGQIDEYKELEYKVISLLISNKKYTIQKLKLVKRRLIRLFCIHVIVR